MNSGMCTERGLGGGDEEGEEEGDGSMCEKGLSSVGAGGGREEEEEEDVEGSRDGVDEAAGRVDTGVVEVVVEATFDDNDPLRRFSSSATRP